MGPKLSVELLVSLEGGIMKSKVTNQSLWTILLVTSLLITSTVSAKTVKYRKTQDVNFDETNIDGVVRNPDGAYLVQKRGIDFMPLYKVRRNFDENIKESAYYIK